MSVQRTNVVGNNTNRLQRIIGPKFGKFAIEVEIHPKYIDSDVNKNPDGTDKPGLDIPLVPLSDRDKSRTVINRRDQRPEINRPTSQPELQLPLYYDNQLPDEGYVPTPSPHEQPPRGVVYLD